VKELKDARVRNILGSAMSFLRRRGGANILASVLASPLSFLLRYGGAISSLER